MKVTSYRTWIS